VIQRSRLNGGLLTGVIKPDLQYVPNAGKYAANLAAQYRISDWANENLGGDASQ
jgi:hypothetical protein